MLHHMACFSMFLSELVFHKFPVYKIMPEKTIKLWNWYIWKLTFCHQICGRMFYRNTLIVIWLPFTYIDSDCFQVSILVHITGILLCRYFVTALEYWVLNNSTGVLQHEYVVCLLHHTGTAAHDIMHSVGYNVVHEEYLLITWCYNPGTV